MKRKVKDANLRRRLRRVMGIRKKIAGTADCPRLAVYRSAKHIYAQLIDDDSGVTIASASTRDKSAREDVKELKKSEAAEKIGGQLAAAAKEKGVERVVFDRRGWPYHGRIAALAKGAREGGLKF